MAEEKKQQQIKIEVDDEIAKGTYSNVAVVFHNQNEFIMDFAFIHPPKAKVVRWRMLQVKAQWRGVGRRKED